MSSCTYHREEAGDDPDDERHVDAAGVHEDSGGRDENAGADDGANDHCAAVEQAHFGLKSDFAAPTVAVGIRCSIRVAIVVLVGIAISVRGGIFPGQCYFLGLVTHFLFALFFLHLFVFVFAHFWLLSRSSRQRSAIYSTLFCLF